MESTGHFRHRSNPSKTRYSVGSKHEVPSEEQRLIDRYLEQKYGINHEDEQFQRHNDLVSSKQIYEMLDAAHRCDNKENQQSNSNFSFKKRLTPARDSSESNLRTKTTAENCELLRRLERAEREIDNQKKMVRELESHLRRSRKHESPADRKAQHSIHTRFVERVQQMMESIEGTAQQPSLQDLWRWLKNKMELYQESRAVVRKLQTLISDKELVRTDEIQRILQGRKE